MIFDGEFMKYLVPLENNNELNSIISSHFGRAPYYAIINVTLDGQYEYKIKSISTMHGDVCGAADLIEKSDVDAVIVKGIGPRAISTLKSLGIKIYKTNSNYLKDLINEILNGKLSLLEETDYTCPETYQSMGYGYGRRWRRRLYYQYPPQPYPPYPPPPMYPPTPYPQQAIKPQLRSGALRIAVACEGRGGLNDIVSMRFGRAPTFTIIDVQNGQIKNVVVEPNPYINQPHGVGIAISQYMASKGVNIAVAGRFGPNAMQILQSLGIRALQVPPGIRVRDVLRYL